MKNLRNCRKALSPVIAAIILVAVTVAVSVAVGAWMGAISFTFMQTEELEILTHSWDTTNTVYIDLSVKNTGSAALTMESVQVNTVAVTTIDFDYGGVAGNQTSQSVSGGSSYTVRIWYSFSSGTKYEFAILTAGGNKYNYVSTAP